MPSNRDVICYLKSSALYCNSLLSGINRVEFTNLYRCFIRLHLAQFVKLLHPSAGLHKPLNDLALSDTWVNDRDLSNLNYVGIFCRTQLTANWPPRGSSEQLVPSPISARTNGRTASAAGVICMLRAAAAVPVRYAVARLLGATLVRDGFNALAHIAASLEDI